MVKNKTAVVIFLGIAVAALLIYMAFYFQGITGRALLDLELNSEEGQNPEGIVRLSLKEGELIPASSKIVFENDGQTYEYVLSEIVSEELVEGNFYVEGSRISGNGKGYGLPGEISVFHEVYFTLSILTEKNNSKISVSGEGFGDKEKISEEEIEEIPEEADEFSNDSGVSEEIVEEEKIETDSETTSDETTGTIGEETSEEIPETVSEETSEEVVLGDSEIPENTIEESATEEIAGTEEEPAEENPGEPSEGLLVTGNIVEGLFGFAANFFLRITGQVSLEIENEIEGRVSLNEEFVYGLKEGQTAEIVKGSVKTDSKELPDNEVRLEKEGNKVIVTTSYSEKEKGFGRNYVGGIGKTITINLPELNLTTGEDLKTSLFYGEEEIVSLAVPLESGEIIAGTETAFNETEGEFENGFLGLNASLEQSNLSLSEKEKTLLSGKFGNVVLKTAKAELIEDRIVIKYELGDYWIEYSYNSDIPDEELEFLMETDRIKFLRDLSKRLSEDKIKSQKIGELIADHDIFPEV